YNVAQQQGGAGRDSEMPPMRDRQTMARRVRGYVTQSKTNTSLGASAPGRVTSSERKALATMGRKGGQKAAQRWKTDQDGNGAHKRRNVLDVADKERTAGEKNTAFLIAVFLADACIHTGTYPEIDDAMDEFGVSIETVKRALSSAGSVLPRGRKKRSN